MVTPYLMMMCTGRHEQMQGRTMRRKMGTTRMGAKAGDVDMDGMRRRGDEMRTLCERLGSLDVCVCVCVRGDDGGD